MTSQAQLRTAVIGALLALLLGGAALAQGHVRARFIHADPTTPAIDIFLNGELAAANLSAGDSTSAIDLPSGASELRVNHAGRDAQILQDQLIVDADAAILLLSGEPLGIVTLADDHRALPAGKSRLQIHNAFADGSFLATSTARDQPPIAEALALGLSIGPIEVAAGRLDLAFVPSGEAYDRSVLEASASLSAGASNILLVYASANSPQLLVASAPTDGAATSGKVSFIHAVQGAAPVDLLIDDQLVAPGLAFAMATPHIAIPAGTRRLSVRLGVTELASVDLEVHQGKLHTVALLGSPGSLRIATYADDPRGPDHASATLRLINALPNSVVERLQLGSGAIIAVDLDFSAAADSVRLMPGQDTLALVLRISDERGTIAVPAHHFYGGSFYNLVAIAGDTFSAPRLLISETSLERRISAALRTDADIAAQPTADEQAAEAVPAVTAEEVDAAAAETTEERQPTPTVAGGEPGPAADVDAGMDEDGSPFLGLSPHAVVNLASDARLQLRQYPTSRALSLGLLPGGSDLMVLGRRGPSVYGPGESADEPVDLSDLTEDPALLLYPYEDLSPSDTWLFVMYQTPDGGALYGWVNAFYLDVFDAIGGVQRLRNLTLVRQNHAGYALNTSMRPTELSDHVSVRVHRLDPGAYLNIRVANSAVSEVLGQLPADARLKLLGLDAAEAWALVEYEPHSPSRAAGSATTILTCC